MILQAFDLLLNIQRITLSTLHLIKNNVLSKGERTLVNLSFQHSRLYFVPMNTQS